MANRPTISVSTEALRDYIERLLRAAGCGAENAAIAAEAFWEADLRGIGLQGLDHVPTLLRLLREGLVDPQGQPKVVRETPASALVDGGRAPGQVAVYFAAELAVKKAAEVGAAAIGITNSADLFMLGLYVERIARGGMVGIAMSDAVPLVRPHGGVERMLGTNPFAVAVPTGGEHPMLFDISTSAVSASRVRQAAYHGEPVPAAAGVGSDGVFTDDSAAVRAGAIGPMAEHRGFGLGLCVALLAGPLTGSNTGPGLDPTRSAQPPSKGHFLIAVDPAAFGDREAFLHAVTAYLNEIKASRKAPGVDAIRIPGERALAVRAATLESGQAVVYRAVWDKMIEWATELSVEVPPVS